MPRESTITVLRSTNVDVPTGLTFGELAYSDLNGKLFVGKDNGSSLWIGAGVTDTTISNNSAYLVPTQSAVKTYVDGVVGGGSVVNTLNGFGGNITITGDGGVITSRSANGTSHLLTARLADNSVTGVASFNSTFFSVSSGAVSLTSAYQATGDTVITEPGSGIVISTNGRTDTLFNSGVTSFNGLTGAVSLTGDGGSSIVRENNVVTNRLATVATTGVAQFDNQHFTVSAGKASVQGSDGSVSGYLLRFMDSTGLSSAIVMNSVFGLTGGVGVSVTKTKSSEFAFSGLTAQLFDPLIAGNSSSAVGVASFNVNHFSISSGGVSLASSYQATGDTVITQPGSGIVISTNGRTDTLFNSGVTSFNGLTGAVSLTGDGGSQIGVENNKFTNRIGSTSLTGVASFDPVFFEAGSSGHVRIKAGGVPNAQLVNSSITIKSSAGDGGQAISLGSSFVVQGTVGEIEVARSTDTFTIGLPDDVTIAGNLTVNGTVVTTNVNNFVTEDPLILLGTGNEADSTDLGFIATYANPVGSKYYTGFFRDASDSGKYKLFTSLTGTAEPTTTVNTSGSGYAVGTIVAKIDGGTF